MWKTSLTWHLHEKEPNCECLFRHLGPKCGYQTEGSVEQGCWDKTGYCQRCETDVDETVTNPASDCYQLVKMQREGKEICALCSSWFLALLAANQSQGHSRVCRLKCVAQLSTALWQSGWEQQMFRQLTAGHFCRVMLRSIRHRRQLNVFIFVPEKRPIRLSLLLLICHEARRNVLLFFHNIPDHVCLKSLQRWSSSILGKQFIRNKQKQKRWPCNSNSIKYNMTLSWLWLWSLECEKTESVWWCNTSLPTSFPFPTVSMFVLDFRLIKPNCENSSGAIKDTSVAI